MSRYTMLIFIAALVAGCKSDPAPANTPPAEAPAAAAPAAAPAAAVPAAPEPAPAAKPVEPAPADAADDEAAQAACEVVLTKIAECRGNRAFKSQVNQTQLKALSNVLAKVKSAAQSECFSWLQQAMVAGGPRFADPTVRESLLQSAKEDCETFGRDFSAAGGLPVDIAGND